MNINTVSNTETISLSPDILRVWIARILTTEQFWEHMLARDDRPEKLFIPRWVARLFSVKYDAEASDLPVLLTHLQAVREAFDAAPPPHEGIIFHNINLLKRFFPLQPLECELLAFRVYLREEWRLQALIVLVIQNHNTWSEFQLHQLLASVLGITQERVQLLLSFESTLIQTGLVSVSSYLESMLEGKLPLLSRLPDALLSRSLDEKRFIKLFGQPVAPATLAMDDFPHMSDEINLLLRYLESSLRSHTTGSNILIHGIPGVGKTEFVRTIAQALNADLYEVPAFSKENGESLPPAERLNLLKLNQALFSHSEKTILLFDEIEDAFQPTPKPFRKDNPVAHNKAWLNQLLENNATPTLWISNQIKHLDRAFLRRFDMVIPMRTPPESVRRRILEQHYQNLPVTDKWLSQAARDPDVPPAFYARSARVLKLADLQDETLLVANEQILRKNFKQAYGCKSAHPPCTKSSIYDPAMINADADIGKLLTGMQRTNRGRLLFYGPPGTGKTALARHMAYSMDKTLIERRASDLISKWLGDTEKLINAAFEHAREENAILLLDEVDSFLCSREQAQHSWEITQVNELLTQIEGHNGVLICCTNHLRHLDAAAIRRFPMKLKFGWLTLQQRVALFCRHLAMGESGVAVPNLVTQRLAKLDQLAPGDFAACMSAAETLGEPISVEWLLDALDAEHALKPGVEMRRIGFTY